MRTLLIICLVFAGLALIGAISGATHDRKMEQCIQLYTAVYQVKHPDMRHPERAAEMTCRMEAAGQGPY
jgi:hypothetical protein